MTGKFDELLETFEEYAAARRQGDEPKADELKGALRASLSAFAVEAVRDNYRSNGTLRELLHEDLGASLTFHIPERSVREGTPRGR